MNKHLAPVAISVGLLGLVGGIAATQAFQPVQEDKPQRVEFVRPAAEVSETVPTVTATATVTVAPKPVVKKVPAPAPVESEPAPAPAPAPVQRQAVVSEPAPEPKPQSEPQPEPQPAQPGTPPPVRWGSQDPPPSN